MKTFTAAALLALTLISSAGGARDILVVILNSVGNDCEQIEISDVTSENAYVIGLSEDDFEKISSAAYYTCLTTGGECGCVICFSDSKSAAKIYNSLWKNYEFPACDGADKMIFLKSGTYVAFFKGDSENTDAKCRAFGDGFGAEAMKIIKNPAKTR